MRKLAPRFLSLFSVSNFRIAPKGKIQQRPHFIVQNKQNSKEVLENDQGLKHSPCKLENQS